MTLFNIETRSDSVLVEIDTEGKDFEMCKLIFKNILKEYLKKKDYYYTDMLLEHLQERGFNVKKVIPIKINWWEIQPIKGIDETVEKLLKSG